MVILFTGGRGILTPEDEATTASVTSTTSFQGIEQFHEKSGRYLLTPTPMSVSQVN